MRVRAILLAVTLALAPLDVRAADLVVWWEKGWNPEEDQAVREIVTAFQQKTGKQIDLAVRSLEHLVASTVAAVEAGHPPDFVFGLLVQDYFAQWAYEGRLAELSDALGPMAAQFDRDALDFNTFLDATTGKRGLYALTMARNSNHVHVWKSLLERAGLTLADIPKQWEPFWAFWCDKVQPAVREATGRNDLYGVGLTMSADVGDTYFQFFQFMSAYEADYVTRDGRLVIDEPQVRGRLVKALDSYTGVWRKGCTPPDAVGWDNSGNNKAFLDQRVVMTVNNTLSIPNALRAKRPEDYYKNVVTLEWPSGAYGQPLAINSGWASAAVLKAGGHVATAKAFVRFLVGEGWLAHWLDFAADRYLPPMTVLLEQPFWLSPGDPHHMAAAIQFLTRPRACDYAAVSGEWRHRLVITEGVWPKVIHRVVADGLTSEQAADEAIARIKQILSE